eukprot:1717742-Heterocapsa_arctica.AAC.1
MHDHQAAVSPHMDENISKEGRNKQGPQALMRGGTPFPSALPPGHVVGVVARLDDGLLRRVRGRLVAAEGKHV